MPKTLRDVLTRWTEAGRRPQPGIHWNLAPWQTEFPEWRKYLASLPNPIDRQAVVDVCRQGGIEPEDAERRFLAAMIWGYGRIGYGPYRTARVLREDAAARATLAKAGRLALTDGGPTAFDWLSRNRLRGLGVAFGTKYLFFCAATGEATPALVLDRLVRGWLANNAGWSLRLDWRSADYRAYVETVTAWAEEACCSAADLEHLMFANATSSDPMSQWREPSFSRVEDKARPPSDSSIGPDETAVLEALDEAAEAFSTLPASAVASQRDHFDRLIQELRLTVVGNLYG
jgi:uncharacterized membrane protein